MELREALTQISEIRTQMARSQLFRGYRSVTTAISGVLAVVAAAIQPIMVPDPSRHLKSYVIHWVGAAVLSLIVVAIEMVLRVRRMGSATQSQLTMLAVEQFTPSLVAGALLTYVIPTFAPEAGWMLPGLWMIVFSLGVFASSRLLPRETFGVAALYLLAGVGALVISQRGEAFSPWLMGAAFGAGQFMMAAVLWWRLERRPGGAQ